jgi:chromosome segregation ATPase
MNPEKLTISQIFGALTLKHISAIIVATVAVIVSAFTFGFSQGQTKAEIQSSKETAVLNSAASQLQSQIESSKSRLEAAQDKVESYSRANSELAIEYKKAQSIISQYNQEIIKLNTALGQTNNCGFFRSQIIELQRKIEYVKHPFMMTNSKDDDEKIQKEVNQLESRLASFVLQSNSCNR